MPFGVGSRVCFVQHFAMIELKVVLSLILSSFASHYHQRHTNTPLHLG